MLVLSALGADEGLAVLDVGIRISTSVDDSVLGLGVVSSISGVALEAVAVSSLAGIVVGVVSFAVALVELLA